MRCHFLQQLQASEKSSCDTCTGWRYCCKYIEHRHVSLQVRARSFTPTLLLQHGRPKELREMASHDDSTDRVSGSETQAPSSSPYPVVEGTPLPTIRTTEGWERQISDLRQMELREDDVFLCCYPKAGTHWLWEVTSMLLQGKVEYEKRRKEQLMMEFVDVSVMEVMESPRILNSHLPLSMLPWQQIRDKRVKIVHVYRNPKDIAVSYYFMMKDILKLSLNEVSMEFRDFFEEFLSGKGFYGSYFTFLRQFHTFTLNNPDVPLLSISFEDMKRNPSENVKKLAKFLQVEVSQQVCEEIAEACSFQKMKKQDENKVFPEHGFAVKEDVGKKSNITIYRKGEVGDWKNHFTVAMSERLDAITEEEMKELPFKMQYA